MVPKQRYAIMREYLPTRGAHALDMMLRTCTVQANFDYDSEKDAIRKLRVALKLAPVTTAMLANSPWKEGAPFGGVTYRGRVWLDVDPDRSGLLPGMWTEEASFATYVEWALDVPMFMFKRNGVKVVNTGQTFRSFWKSGFQGERPTQGDWQTHLNTLFPEVRLKKTIEIRGADAQKTGLACALPALWTGIFYDDQALAEAEALAQDWSYAEVAARPRAALARRAARAVPGAPLQGLAERVIEIAEGGLERRGFKRQPDGKDERVHLARLKELVAKGQTPADALLAWVKPGPSFAQDVLAAVDFDEGLSPPRRLDERTNLRRVLHSGRALDAARDVDAVGQHCSIAARHVLRREPPRERQLPLARESGNERPVERLAGSSERAFDSRVHEQVVAPVYARRIHVRRAPHAHRLVRVRQQRRHVAGVSSPWS